MFADEGCFSYIKQTGDSFVLHAVFGRKPQDIPAERVTKIDAATIKVNGIEYRIPTDDNGICD